MTMTESQAWALIDVLEKLLERVERIENELQLAKQKLETLETKALIM